MMTWLTDGWVPRIEPVECSLATLDRLLAALIGMNVDYLRDVGPTCVPLLYETHVRYLPDLVGRERWATIPHVYTRGIGDCKSLSAWRCAELIVRGENAIACVQEILQGEGSIFHVLVRREDGSLEDPSWRLGMGWKEGYAI